MLFREYTDIWNGNYHNWKTRIDGIEIFSDYITDLQRTIYNTIYNVNALGILPALDEYDLIYCGDVLEHFTREEGFELVNLMKLHSKNVIIVTPKIVYEQGAVFDNVYETHRSQWEASDFPDSKVIYFNNSMLIEWG